MRVRGDLLGLTRPVLVALSNAGFVKRAERELEQGAPVLALSDDGTLVAAFTDGAEATLPPGVSLQASRCSCGATPMCRHRVLTVLAYQKAAATAERPATSATATWSPADVDDATLERALGKSALARAATARRRGVLAEVRRGTFVGEDVPSVHMSTSSVRFLVPGDVAHARCDCTLRTACEHVALAVWAFTAAVQKDPAAQVVSVELVSGTTARVPHTRAAVDLAAVVLLEGVAKSGSGGATRFALARRSLKGAGYAWPLAAVEDLEVLLDAYRRRSALYSAPELASVIAEIVARARAAECGTQLPSSAVLGVDEAIETPLDQRRLYALGARVRADGDHLLIRIFFADPGSEHICVLERRTTKPETSASETGIMLASRSVLAGSPLSVVATGQVVSNAVIRRANRVVSFGTGALKNTSVMYGPGTLEALPQALVVRDLKGYWRQAKQQAPPFLRPRFAVGNMLIVAVMAVDEVFYDDAAQAVMARCLDESGNPFWVRLAYRAECPQALFVLTKAMGAHTKGVIGTVGASGVVEPMTVVTDRFVALDLESETDELSGLPNVQVEVQRPPLVAALHEVASVLETIAHQGLRALAPGWTDRVRAGRAAVMGLGMAHLAADLESLDHAVVAARTSGGDEEERAVVDAWVTAQLRTQLLALHSLHESSS